MLFKIVENLRDQKERTKLHASDTYMFKNIIEQLNEIKALQLYALANTFEELYKQ